MSVEQIRQIGDELASDLHHILGLRLRCSKQDACSEASTASSRHPHHELIYIEAGEGALQLGPELVRTGRGDLFVIPPDAFHRHGDPKHWLTWSLAIQPDAAWGTLSGVPRRFSVPESERARWEARFRYLERELDSDDRVADTDAVRSMVNSILRDVEQLSRGSSDTHDTGRRKLRDLVFGYIDAHYREPISLHDVAAAVHFSPAYLTDLIRRETGRPIHQWINERRMHAARLLLALTDRPIAGIAEEVGFRDSTYFGRHFAKVSGQTPRAWRDQQRLGTQIASNDGTPWTADTTCTADYTQLRALGDRLSLFQDRDEVDSAVLDTTYATFKPTVAQILRRDAGRRVSTVCLQHGTRELANFPTERDSDGAFPMVVVGQTIVAQELQRSPLETHRRLGCLGYRSLLVAPVMAGSRCIGAIRLLEREPRAFSERGRALLAMIGALTGLAMRSIATEAWSPAAVS
ncbi:MAG: helix-turn-helix domain-containing protein [Vulcanimicrobiaceae bacterium]